MYYGDWRRKWKSLCLWDLRSSSAIYCHSCCCFSQPVFLTSKLKLQYFGHLMWRVDSFEKTPILGKIEGRRKRGWQRMRWLDGIDSMHWPEFEQTLSDSEGQGSLACYTVHEVTKSQTPLSDWTTATITVRPMFFQKQICFNVFCSPTHFCAENTLSLVRELLDLPPLCNLL